MTITQPRLGVDIARVIIDGSAHPDGDDTAFFTGDTTQMLRTPPVADVFDVLPGLVARFDGRVWLVSKCGERVRRRTLQWLDHHDFAARTGIPAEHVRFCRARPDKAIHCAALRITHFIDDKLDVHAALRDLVPHRYLFGGTVQITADLLIKGETPDDDGDDRRARAGRGVGGCGYGYGRAVDRDVGRPGSW